MANVTEGSNWESGIYRIETTDPVGGGESGIDNLPHKQLAARTQYLKAFADEVLAARGSLPSLDARLDLFEPLEASTTNAIISLAMAAMSQAGLAQRELEKLQNKRMQTGLITIKNRGVISGCAVTKSGTASRNLAIAAGAIFLGGRIFPVFAESAGAAVPPNAGLVSAICYAYLYVTTGGAIAFACTGLGEAVPEDGLSLYQITVPANNTDVTDPTLTLVTLTDIRRIEPNYPTWFATSSYVAVALAYPLLDAEYTVALDVVSIKGAGLLQGGDLYVGSRNVNGFNVYYNGIADTVKVRWSIRRAGL